MAVAMGECPCTMIQSKDAERAVFESNHHPQKSSAQCSRIDSKRRRRGLVFCIEMLLREHLPIALSGPGSQAVGLIGHEDDTIVHLDNDRRHRCLLCHLNLVDGTAAARPVMPKLVLSLPVCPAASFDQVFVVQPLGGLGRKVEVLLRCPDIFQAGQATRSRSDEAVVVVLLPEMAIPGKHAVLVRESTLLVLCDEMDESLLTSDKGLVVKQGGKRARARPTRRLGARDGRWKKGGCALRYCRRRGQPRRRLS